VASWPIASYRLDNTTIVICRLTPPFVYTMAGRLAFTAALFVTAAFAVPAPQDQFNVATTNTSSSNSQPSQTSEVTNSGAAASPSPSSLGGLAAALYHSPAWLPHGSDLKPALPQSKTNGNSKLGTFGAPALPKWLGGGGTPWGGLTASNANQYTVSREPPFLVVKMLIVAERSQYWSD
jgi:hypothetical protein